MTLCLMPVRTTLTLQHAVDGSAAMRLDWSTVC